MWRWCMNSPEIVFWLVTGRAAARRNAVDLRGRDIHALQGQCRASPQDPQDALSGDQLARLRCGSGSAGEPDALGDREAFAAWHEPSTGKRGGQPVYSRVAIETGLALRLALHQPLRQTDER
jgi:hypothetical protein